MTQDIESALRGALRPVEPDEGFAERVMARITNEPLRPMRPQRRWMPYAIAASLVGAISVLVGTHQHEQRIREGQAARAQLMAAMQMTGDKLELVYQAVNDSSAASDSSTESMDTKRF
jgi:negative regulator of sigma E activity